jgi:hypothetical protein
MLPLHIPFYRAKNILKDSLWGNWGFGGNRGYVKSIPTLAIWIFQMNDCACLGKQFVVV